MKVSLLPRKEHARNLENLLGTFLWFTAARTTVNTTDEVASVAPPMTTNVPAVAAPALRRGFMFRSFGALPGCHCASVQVRSSSKVSSSLPAYVLGTPMSILGVCNCEEAQLPLFW